MEFRYTRNARLLLLTFLGAFLASLSYLTNKYNPGQLITDQLTRFHPNSLVYDLWKEPPFDVFLKFHIFNVTNSKEFLEGKEKLIFNEVGPYAYIERLIHANSTFNENGTISFIPKRFLTFSREHSVGDPTLDTIIVPNLPLLGITSVLNDYSIFLQIGFSSVTSYMESQSFTNFTVSDFLSGYEDPLVKLANDFVPSWIDFSRFGLIDLIMANDNKSSTVTMNVNPKINVSNNPPITAEEKLRPFSIQYWNGSPGLKQWGYEIQEDNETLPQNTRCNTVEGTFMGTLFPLNMEKNSSYSLYREAFCRPIPIIYTGNATTKDGFEGYVYKVNPDFLATPEENSDNACYCSSHKCLYKGLTDVSPCYYDMPVSLSQPHFLNADPLLLENFIGLSPNESKHDTIMTVHPLLGIVMQANIRLQINLVIPETHYNSKTRPFNNMVLPLLWIELGLDDLPSQIKFYLILLYNVLPTAQLVIIYVFAISGIVLIFGPSLIIFLCPDNSPPKSKLLHINYSQIPIFSLKEKILKPEVLIKK